MDVNEEDHEEIETTDDYYFHLNIRNTWDEPKTLLEHLQGFFSRKTILCIQYCLLRIPFLLVYDYLFTEQYLTSIQGFLQYSIKVIDREEHLILKPISSILRSYVFQVLVYINMIFSIPVLGLILLTVLLLCSDQRLTTFYSLYENLGIQALFSYLQQRIKVTMLLKIFWLTKIMIIPLGIRTIYTNPFITHNTTDGNITNEMITDYNETLSKTIYFTTVFYGTETMFTLISLACLVSHALKIVSRRLFHVLSLWSEDVEQIGTVIGIMFLLLLFQSNITRMDLNRRHIPLLKALSLIIIALFHFLHTILEPELLKVAMQTMTVQMVFDETDEYDEKDAQNKTHKSVLKRYFSRKILNSFQHRHVYTCVSVLFFIIIYITSLWYITPFSTWLLAVTAFSFELIVRLLSSLAQYTLYVFDAHHCFSNLDSFDEYIFRVKAIGSCCEFMIGVFLLFNGFYILCFEARGALRALMLAIHAHLNIIKNLRRGWQILRNRKSAWNNVSKLPLATEEQIRNYNDICSICHNSLTIGSTCVTPCSHLFHQKCLQKAFYGTRNCALCSRQIIEEKTGQGQ